jgi:hypothetical protein
MKMLSLLNIETASWYAGQADHLVWRGLDGKLNIPPESIANYKRANALLIRYAAIVQAQTQRGLAVPIPPNMDTYIKQLNVAVSQRLDAVRK